MSGPQRPPWPWVGVGAAAGAVIGAAVAFLASQKGLTGALMLALMEGSRPRPPPRTRVWSGATARGIMMAAPHNTPHIYPIAASGVPAAPAPSQSRARRAAEPSPSAAGSPFAPGAGAHPAMRHGLPTSDFLRVSESFVASFDPRTRNARWVVEKVSEAKGLWERGREGEREEKEREEKERGKRRREGGFKAKV